jgi:Helix-turn-helix domain
MPLEHSPGREIDRAAYTIDEFCDAHRISRSRFYALLREGRGPRVMRIDSRIRISREAAVDWRRASEAAA